MAPAQAVCEELNGMTGDALLIAEEALKAAAEATAKAEAAEKSRNKPSVDLVKVAKERYARTAQVLKKSGAFPDNSEEDLAKNLEQFGTAGYLELLEKVASNAVFPLDGLVDLGGDLVEKTPSGSADPKGMDDKSARWRAALDEAEAEVAASNHN